MANSAGTFQDNQLAKAMFVALYDATSGTAASTGTVTLTNCG
jgi:hypothetical protein